MPRGPLGGPRPLAQCSLGVQVTKSSGSFTESDLTNDIQLLDSRLEKERREGRSSVVMTVDNARLIAGGKAAAFRVSPKVMNREQLENSLDVIEDYFGSRVRTVAVTITD